ncbi:MAG: hypothetical protein FIA92_06985 [Chloroflexi bacterium]|nr:hypothetical protein [Chloroflexota bacterium]
MTEETTPPPPPPPVAVPAPPPAPASAPASAVAQQVAAGSRRVWGGLDPTTRRPTLAVAILIAGLFFGSQVLNEAIPANAGGFDGGPGTLVSIGPNSQITPLAGWTAGRLEGGGLRLEKGYVAVDLFAPSASGTAADLARSYVNDVLRPSAEQLTATDPQVASGEAGSAARLQYAGIFSGANGTIEGEVTVFVASGGAVVADAWSPQGGLAPLLDEVHLMLNTIEVGS